MGIFGFGIWELSENFRSIGHGKTNQKFLHYVFYPVLAEEI